MTCLFNCENDFLHDKPSTLTLSNLLRDKPKAYEQHIKIFIVPSQYPLTNPRNKEPKRIIKNNIDNLLL